MLTSHLLALAWLTQAASPAAALPKRETAADDRATGGYRLEPVGAAGAADRPTDRYRWQGSGFTAFIAADGAVRFEDQRPLPAETTVPVLALAQAVKDMHPAPARLLPGGGRRGSGRDTAAVPSGGLLGALGRAATHVITHPRKLSTARQPAARSVTRSWAAPHALALPVLEATPQRTQDLPRPPQGGEAGEPTGEPGEGGARVPSQIWPLMYSLPHPARSPRPPTSVPRLNRPTRVAALLFAVAWGTNHFVPLLPLYRAALGLGPTELAQVFGIYAIGLLPGLLLGGPISDRIGRRRLVVPAALVALAGTVLLGVGRASFARLLLGRFVVGVGSGASFSAATAWLQDLAAQAPTTKGAGARRAATALSAGFGGGPLVASLLAQWLPAPLTLPYAVQFAVLSIAIAGVARLPAPPTPTPTSATSSPIPPPTAAPRRFVPPGFLSEVVPVAPWVFGLPSISFAVLPAVVRERLGGYSVLFGGIVTAATLFSGLLVQTPLRARSAQTAGRFGVAVGLLGLGIAAAATAARSPVGVLLAAVVLGAGYGGCLVAGLRFVEGNSLPHERGRLTGVFYVLAYLGFSAPLILAALARRHGNTTAVLCAAGLALLSLILRLIPWSGDHSPDRAL